MLQHQDMSLLQFYTTGATEMVTEVAIFTVLVLITVLVMVLMAVALSNLTPTVVDTTPTKSNMYTEDGTQKAMLSSTSPTFSKVLALLTAWDMEVLASTSRLVATPALAVIPLICTAMELGITTTITMITMATELSMVRSSSEESSIATITEATADMGAIWAKLTQLRINRTETMLGATFD